MDVKNITIAVVIAVLVLVGSFMVLNRSPQGGGGPVKTDQTQPGSTQTRVTGATIPSGTGICTDPSNKYSIPNKNGCKNANDLGTCRLDLNSNKVTDVDEICGAGFQACCCSQGYSNCC